MATNQVPGFGAAKNDKLHDKCWAERQTDAGHLLFIDRVNEAANAVTYTEINLRKMTQVQGAATIAAFHVIFSDAGWLWHDKSERPAVPAELGRHEHVPDAKVLEAARTE